MTDANPYPDPDPQADPPGPRAVTTAGDATGELRRALAASQRLVATTAHELRTPLTTISGMAETLERRSADLSEANRLQLLASLRRQTDRLIRLVGDLLVLAAADAGAVRLNRRPVELAEVIAEAQADSGLDLHRIRVHCPLGLQVNADPARLLQILVNLLGNADKHGGGSVTIDASADDAGVTLLVSDEGPGVEDRFVEHLWERFSRSPGARDRDPRGSGLGLAIIEELALAHGGRAWYEANHPQGARFGVWLPREAGEIDLRAEAEPVAPAPVDPGSAPAQLEAVSAALREAPITVFSVNGAGTFVMCQGRDLEALGLVGPRTMGTSALGLPVIGGLVVEALAGIEGHQVVEIGDRAYEITCRPGAGGAAGQGAHGLAIDVTEWHSTGRDLAHAASHDHLTGLPNRGLLIDRLEMALSRLSRSGGAVAVLFLDLDRFKAVNDELGHAAGDRLLIAAARRLEAVVRPGDTVARYSGDEFVVVCEVSDEGDRDAGAVAERIDSAFRLPFTIDGHEVRTSASIGLAVTTDPKADGAGLVRQADRRMYVAKGRGRARREA
jgi:diguanylate cyclase (GGDEF)-like protein